MSRPDDIVTRLRDPEMCMCDGENPCVVCVALTEIERLRSAGDEMADAATRQHWSRLDVAVADWQEARRG